MVFLAYFQTIYRDFSQDISSNKKKKKYIEFLHLHRGNIWYIFKQNLVLF